MFIPPATEAPIYDLDGNQTADAHWNYAWDCENRLILAEEKPIPTAVAAGVSPPSVTTRQKIEFSYDSQNRRLRKVVQSFSSTDQTWSVTSDLRFLYDGWNLVAELNMNPATSTLELTQSYEWGNDISGTMTGAGGVGGLLIERFHSATTSTTVNNSQPPSTGAHAPCYDGNGNITELVNLANDSVSARYDYGAFGETISVDGGAVAEANPFRFSTKYLDAETGFYNYTHRYYDAVNGRWPSRDPIEERGGINLYGMVGNDPVNQWDYLGMDWSISTILRGQQGKYSGVFCASNTKDTFDELKNLLPGNSAKIKLTYVSGSSFRVDASEYLAALEDELRQSVVSLCGSFQQRGAPFGAPPLRPPSYNQAQINAFFDPKFDANKLPTIDCYVAIHLIMARAAQQAMGPAYGGTGYQSGHFYKEEKGILKQNGITSTDAMRLGDWGYIHGYESVQPDGKGGKSYVSTSGNPATTGENIVKVGSNNFYGFFTGGGSDRTPGDWRKILEGGGQAPDAGPGPHRFGRVDDAFFIDVARIASDTFNFNAKKK